MYLFPIPAFTDNYFWLLHDGKRALAVDSGAAKPALHALQQHAPQLESILVTHHHSDHTGGFDALRQATGAQVYGPAQKQASNPYLCIQETIRAAARRFDASATHDTHVFTAIRQWKNQFK